MRADERLNRLADWARKNTPDPSLALTSLVLGSGFTQDDNLEIFEVFYSNRIASPRTMECFWKRASLWQG
jgi:hypothetical protein